MKNALIWIGLIVLIIGGAYYLWDESRDDTGGDVEKEGGGEVAQIPEGWLGYENEEYEFSYVYPQEWEVQEALKPRDITALHEVSVHEKEYDMWRGEVETYIYMNESGATLDEWWNARLAASDIEKEACVAEHGDTAPCLVLRDLVEREGATTLGGKDAIEVGLFQFDHEKQCTYAADGEYVYGVCYPSEGNPNDPKAAEHDVITEQIRDSFVFVAE